MKITQLHLRRVGVEARPDLVRGNSKDDGASGNPGEKNNREEDPDYPPKDDDRNAESSSTENQLPGAPESSNSQGSDEPPLSTAKNSIISEQSIMQHQLRRQQIMAASQHLYYGQEFLVLYLVGSLYITANNCSKFRQSV